MDTAARRRAIRWTVALAAMLAPWVVGCRPKAMTANPRCVQMLAVLDRCDPSARTMPVTARQALVQSCPKLLNCGAVDVSYVAGCARFMGCLYDRP